jgi:hypothetical protein
MDGARGSGYIKPPNADNADEQSDKSGEDSDPEESCADHESVWEGEGDGNSDDTTKVSKGAVGMNGVSLPFSTGQHA